MWGISQFTQPPGWWEGLRNFSEGFFRRNLGLLGGNWHLRWGQFFQVVLENSLCWGNLGTFQFTSAKCQQEKLPMTHQKLLYIMSTTALACLNILSVTIIWFSNSWDYLFYLNYIWLKTYTWMGEMETTFVSLITLLWFLFVSLL